MKLQIASSWKKVWTKKAFRIETALTLSFLVFALIIFNRFVSFVESRNGAVLSDPLLNLFPAYDVTWPTFALIYVSLAVALVAAAASPKKMVEGVQVYSLLLLTRMLAMYVTPLAPPEEMIVLRDPIVELFGSSRILTKDLFFSGHTATLFMFYLTAQAKWLRRVFLVNTCLVALFVLLQHVHYTIDVLAAPFFCYGCFRIVGRFHNTIGQP